MGGRRTLQRALEVEAALQLRDRRRRDAETRDLRAARASRFDDRRCQREDFGLPLPVAQRLLHRAAASLRRTGEPRLRLLAREPVQGQIGAPGQGEDERRASHARAQEKPALQ